tara:strand:+ start:599 stop:979 length:381 start_codon:yes stop_codon:yes gene_type:complete
MDFYDKVKKKLIVDKNINLSKFGLEKVSIIEFVALLTNLLVFPAVFFQATKTWGTKDASDMAVLFNLSQFLGGTPEGIIGIIIGHLIGSIQMMAIGIFASVYHLFMVYFICFGKKGIIKDLYTNKK